jgi:hypothetical protein
MLTKLFPGLFSSLVIIAALSATGCASDSMHDDGMMMKEDKMMKDDGMMKEDKMMKDDDKMMKDSM